jgi:uncharacterized membrane protein
MHPSWTPVRVLLVLVTLTGLVWLARSAPCSDGGSWFGDDPFSDLCYSDLPLRYADEGHAERTLPYTDTSGRYPETTATPPVAYAAWATSVVAQALSGWPDAGARGDLPLSQLVASPGMHLEATTYFYVAVLMLFGCALATTVLLARSSGRRPWDAAAFAAAPALLLAGTIGWDLLAVLLVVAGWAAWERRRPVAAGVLTGLGVATAVWPLALLPAVVVVAVRSGRGRDAGLTALAAVTCWTVAQLPALALGLDGWWQTVAPRLGEPAGYGSLWGLAADGGTPPDPALMSGLAVGAACLLVVAVAVVSWSAPSCPRVAQVTLLVLVGWLLVWPVYSPQQVLWLLPFAVLARPRWRDLLVWQAGETLYFLAIWTHLSGATADSGAVDKVYGFAVVLRLAAELYLAAVVLRDIREPEHDPVRAVAAGPDVMRRAAGTPPQR